MQECQLSYNPGLMALLWDALATRDIRALRHATECRFETPEGCAWVNYVRCHDDIGWAFSNDDMEAVGFDPDEHRRFLTKFYTGKFRHHDQSIVLVLANFSEHEQRLEARRLRQMGLRKTFIDLVAGRAITATQELVMEPYQFMVLSQTS